MNVKAKDIWNMEQYVTITNLQVTLSGETISTALMFRVHLTFETDTDEGVSHN